MKIACIDKTASQRIKLQTLLEELYQSSRATLGHLPLTDLYSTSIDELLLNSEPSLVLIGPGYEIDEAANICSKIKKLYPNLDILIFVKDQDYEIRNLKKLDNLVHDTFSTKDSSTRFLHTLYSLLSKKDKSKKAKLLTINGVKGGIGTTSIASGFAHASFALGKKSIVVDLSLSASLIQYSNCKRRYSAKLTECLEENTLPTPEILKEITDTSPNGIDFLLPPLNETNIRELWLRNHKRLEISIALIEILKSSFDIIIIDTARSEGILNYVLNSYADSRILVSSNEPASLHLLSREYSTIKNIPGNSATKVLLNRIEDDGLTIEDLIDFLSSNEDFDENNSILKAIPFDKKAKSWIGTGNSFYTEGSKKLQKLLEQNLECILKNQNIKKADPENLFFRLISIFTQTKSEIANELPEESIKLIPSITNYY